MDIIKDLLAAIIAAIPLAKLAEAMRKDYAKKHGLDPDSTEALLTSSENLLWCILLVLLITVPVYGWFVYDSGLTCGKLSKAMPYIAALASFIPRLFVLTSIPVMACCLFLLILKVTKDNHASVINATEKMVVKGLKILRILAALALLFAELYCIADGSLEYLNVYFDGLNKVVVIGYTLTVALISSAMYYLFICGGIFAEGLPAIAGAVNIRRKERREKRKMSKHRRQSRKK